jgi:enoyl-CoA hydratase/carnithine racemase
MEMIMTAGMVSADDAYRTGLVNHVVPQAALLEFLMASLKNHEKFTCSYNPLMR